MLSLLSPTTQADPPEPAVPDSGGEEQGDQEAPAPPARPIFAHLARAQSWNYRASLRVSYTPYLRKGTPVEVAQDLADQFQQGYVAAGACALAVRAALHEGAHVDAALAYARMRAHLGLVEPADVGGSSCAGQPGCSDAHAAGLEGDGFGAGPAGGELMLPGHGVMALLDDLGSASVVLLVQCILGPGYASSPLAAEAFYALGAAPSEGIVSAADGLCVALCIVTGELSIDPTPVDWLGDAWLVATSQLPWPARVVSPAMRFLSAGGMGQAASRHGLREAIWLLYGLMRLLWTECHDQYSAATLPSLPSVDVMDDMVAVIADAYVSTGPLHAFYDHCLAHALAMVVHEAPELERYDSVDLDLYSPEWEERERLRRGLHELVRSVEALDLMRKLILSDRVRLVLALVVAWQLRAAAYPLLRAPPPRRDLLDPLFLGGPLDPAPPPPPPPSPPPPPPSPPPLRPSPLDLPQRPSASPPLPPMVGSGSGGYFGGAAV